MGLENDGHISQPEQPVYRLLSYAVGFAQNMEPFLSKKEVKFAFDRAGGNARAAAELLEVNHQTFINYARAYDFPIGDVGRPSVTDDWDPIRNAWESGASAEEIYEIFPDVKPGTTRQRARRKGWSPHKPGAKKKNS